MTTLYETIERTTWYSTKNAICDRVDHVSWNVILSHSFDYRSPTGITYSAFYHWATL